MERDKAFALTRPRPTVRPGSARSTQESGGLQLGRDLLHGLLDVRGLAGACADELAAAEEEDDDLRHVDPVDEPGELLRLVLDLLEAQGDRDRVQVDLRAEVRGGDDVLDHDLRVVLDRDARGLDLLGDDVDRLLHVLEALRARAHDLPASEEQGRGLRLLQAVDESRELLRFVLRAAEREGDRLQVELLSEGRRCDDVLDLDLRQGNTSADVGPRTGRSVRRARARFKWGVINVGAGSRRLLDVRAPYAAAPSRAFTRACNARFRGVASPCRSAARRIAPVIASISVRRPRSRSWSMLERFAAVRLAISVVRWTVSAASIATPSARATAAASRQTASTGR